MKKKQGYAYYRREYSRKGYRRVFRVILLFFLFCSAIQFVKTFLIDVYTIRNTSMQPVLVSGKRVVATPVVWGVKNPFTGKAFDFISRPDRGDLVVMVSPHVDEYSWGMRYLDQYIRFLSLQKLSFVYRNSPEWGSAFQVKRIVALPGETVYIKNYQAFIRKADSDNFIIETLLTDADYNPQTGTLNGSQAPFSTDSEAVTLGSDQYFVLGDNRPSSLDSRTYGPVSRDRISAKILFSY